MVEVRGAGNRRSEATRRRLLDAAFDVGSTVGAAGLTLDAVAERAGTSKGGLLYHFPTKDALLAAMVDETLDQFAEHVAEHVAGDAIETGRSARAYVRASMAEGDKRATQWSALLMAFFTNPELAELWRERALSWTTQDAADGGDPVEATIARLAVDGLWFRELLGVSPVAPSMRRSVEERLVERTRATVTRQRSGRRKA